VFENFSVLRLPFPLCCSRHSCCMRSLEPLLRPPPTDAPQSSSSGSIVCIFQLRGLAPQTCLTFLWPLPRKGSQDSAAGEFCGGTGAAKHQGGRSGPGGAPARFCGPRGALGPVLTYQSPAFCHDSFCLGENRIVCTQESRISTRRSRARAGFCLRP